MQLTEQAKIILEKRYLAKDEHGRVIETPDEMFRRVASDIAKAERDPHQWEDKFYQIMADLDFLPNSPCLANAGRANQQLSACFVIPIEDSMEGIFDAVKAAALVHKTGGGTGFSFSRLRPRNSIVASTGQTASGPIEFMRVFNAATEAVKQGGMRRGANMGILRVDHPDILDFIHCKDDDQSLQNFNISVYITSKFLRALDENKEYNLIDPRNGSFVGSLNAKYVWDELVKSAWRTGDPGIWFGDRVNASKGNPVPSLGPIESCNPCGEQELYPWDSCNLGSINLSKFLHAPTPIDPHLEVDYERLSEVVDIAVRFLDDVIDRNTYIIPEIGELSRRIRRIGLGVMGWADMLFQLRVPYDSVYAVSLAEKVMDFINERARKASEDLAKERGAFPLFNLSIYRGDTEIRNCTRTTIAPTGTISLIAGCSSGIEPVFELEYTHSGLEGALQDKVIRNPHYELALTTLDKGTIKSVFKTAHQIKPIDHLIMQAAFQEYTDNAVSKTINLPHDATVHDVDLIYRTAIGLGLKGVTIYRDGSKGRQVLTKKEVNDVQEITRNGDEPMGEDTTNTINPSGGHNREVMAVRPTVLEAKVIKQPTPFGNAYITVAEIDKGEPFEVFVTIGKAGSDIQAMSEGLGRLISYQLRSSTARRDTLITIADQLRGIGGSQSIGFGKERVRSVPEAIAMALTQYLGDKQVLFRDEYLEMHSSTGKAVLYKVDSYSLCPDCGQLSVRHEGGCAACAECGWSMC